MMTRNDSGTRVWRSITCTNSTETTTNRSLSAKIDRSRSPGNGYESTCSWRRRARTKATTGSRSFITYGSR